MRNLWLLRMQTLPNIESLGEESSQEQYSSITSGSESELEASRRAKARKLPHIVESLCLCYLSMVLLQLPISFGQLNQWLSEDGFTFVTAFEELPVIMTRNLAAEYRAALQARVCLSISEEGLAVELITPRSPLPSLVECSGLRQNSYACSPKRIVWSCRRSTTTSFYFLGYKSSHCHVRCLNVLSKTFG